MVTVILCALIFNLIFYNNAYAYIDPGTGSYFLQMIIATALGGLFMIKLYWQKVKALVSNMFCHKSNSDTK